MRSGGSFELVVLGEIEVRPGGAQPVRPRGPTQRLLLASLLAQAPRPLTAERLIGILWPETLPLDPGAALRTQVSRLRALFADGGLRDVVRREPAGYRLALGGGSTDAARFEALVAHAARETAPEAALASLDEALGLWRGEPFAELTDQPSLLAESDRLRQLLATARLRRAERLLDLGRHHEALAEIEPLVAADPLRERPRALHMQALYRAGRQAEALAVGQDFRRLLSEELGVDPSPALRSLEDDIRRHGEGLEAAAGGSGERAGAPTGLPSPLTRLVGRGEELATSRRLLASGRLLTLTGTGGNGKTRLALALAESVRDSDDRDVCWVELQAIADGAFVPQAVAASLGIRERAARSDTESIVAALGDRPLLVVLDNCEHLLAACAGLAGALLAGCPGTILLATSREPLGLPGEISWPVPPLPVPPAVEEGFDDLDALSRWPAIDLFVERAAAVRPGFALTGDNASGVAQLCRALDGIPLAIELAAARTRVFSIEEIGRRLEGGLGLLSRGARGWLPRHQTLRAALDWSHDLLDEDERRLFEALSVFAGGFTLAAAEGLVDPDPVAHGSLLDGLAALVEKSLVVAEPTGDESRYRLLETVRSYGRERLGDGPRREALERRHAELFAALAEEAEPLLISPRRAVTGRRLRRDQDNVRAALAWALGEGGDLVVAHRLVGALWWYWHYVGGFAEARRWAEAVLARPADGIPAAQRSRVLYTAAMACWLLGDPVAARLFGEEAVRLARRTGDDSLLVKAISCHAFALRDVGELEEAKELAGECVVLARQAGFPPREMGFALWIHCTALLDAGDVAPAEAAAAEAEALWRATGDRWGLSMVLHGLAMARLGCGELDAAADHFREAVELLRHDGEAYVIARSIEGLAIVRVHQGDADRASRLFGAAEAIREAIQAPLLALEEARYRRTVDLLAPLLASQKRAAAWAEGRALGLEGVIAYVLDGEPPTTRI